MRLELITLHGIKLDSDAYEVQVPTIDGEIGIFPGHEALVTVAKPGVIAVRYHKDDADDDLDYFAISGGVIEVSQTAVRILVDEADSGDDIVESESKAALERAVRLKSESDDQVEIEKAQALIDRHQVRLKVADLHRRHRR